MTTGAVELILRPCKFFRSVSVMDGSSLNVLLGMVLMTDGLKMVAGPALSRVLASSTQTRLCGLVSGVVITALVQSSSVVTVAAIGFVNAGLLLSCRIVFVPAKRRLAVRAFLTVTWLRFLRWLPTPCVAN